MRRAGRWTARALAALGLLMVFVTVTPIEGWWIQWLAGPWNDPQGDVLVVLGAGSVRDVIDWSSYWRSVYAVRSWREGGFHQVLVSGGSLGGETPAAERMRDFMVSQGVPASAIQVEGDSHSTHENALRSKALLDKLPGRKVLLTSDYHMFRAVRVFHKAGIDIAPRPLPDAAKRINSWPYRWPVFWGLCLETTKIVYYYARGWI
ncbi:MAG TPA: YdcF family protein [Bryobacteraceae bacterium]|nr:YdcF family protein [Bryobacteraceae bacterium]